MTLRGKQTEEEMARRDRFDILDRIGVGRDGAPKETEFNPGVTDDLPPSYQIDLARLLLKDRSFALDYSRHFNPDEHVDNPVLALAMRLTLLWWEKHQKPPTLQNVRDGLRVREQKGMLHSSLAYGVSALFENQLFRQLENDPVYIKENSKRWLKRQILEGLHEEAGQWLDRGEDEKALKAFEKASGIHFNEGVEEESYVSDTETAIKRRTYRNAERIPLGLGHDGFMDGGVDRQTLTLFGAPSDVGKTTVSAAVGGHVVECGYKVAHVSLETPLDDVRDLYDSRFTGIPRNELRDNPQAIRDLIEGWQREGKDPLRICRWKPFDLTPARIRDWLTRLRVEGFYPDFLIIDSPDEMIPYEGYSEGLYQQANVTYLLIIGILVDFNVAGFITSQTTRETYGQESIRLSQLSDSLNKARRAHTVIFGAQTDAMRSARPYAYIGGILAKQKKGKVNVIVPLECDYAKTRFRPVTVDEMNRNLGTGYTLLEEEEV